MVEFGFIIWLVLMKCVLFGLFRGMVVRVSVLFGSCSVFMCFMICFG